MFRNLLLSLTISLLFFPTIAMGSETSKRPAVDMYEERLNLYKKSEETSLIPWYFFAAIDQYERNVRLVRPDIPKKTDGVISINIRPELWYGSLLYEKPTNNAAIISLLGGIGRDGNGDGIADPNQDEDILASMQTYLLTYGVTEDQWALALWDWYQRDVSVATIRNYAKIYQKYKSIRLDNHSYIMPLYSNHSIKASYGDARSFGGRRMHEGVDIFAPYGVPVKSVSYGYIELKGWNRLGGWRIGIRDMSNNYHYYAHLGGYAKGLETGQIVEPGTVVGYVGSTGYGPPGTAGKFPPHLHYGIYKDNGKTEWSFDPYHFLLQWKRVEKSKH